MPATNIMQIRQIGLYNPNAYVRGGAVEALGKVYGVNAIEKARKEESEARARVEQYASQGADVPYTPTALTSEELAVHSEFTVDDDYEEEKEEPSAVGGEALGSGEEPREPVPVAGAAAAAAATAEEEAGNKPAEKEKKKKKVCYHRTNRPQCPLILCHSKRSWPRWVLLGT